MAKNEGKKFEEDFKNSVVTMKNWIYRFNDNASSFGGGNKTRFATTNICDFEVFVSNKGKLLLLELKSTKEKALSISNIRENQIDGLKIASNYENIIAGIIINFREINNYTYFISIENYIKMMNNINKKSFTIENIKEYDAIKIDNCIKRTRYKYDVENFIKEVCN